ncbi:hypothetical protein H1R20_g15726, partial [Candolleomyces eurysporus]
MTNKNFPIATLETVLKIARRFENGCKTYISEKGIKEDEQVRRILNACFQDNRIIHWIDGNRERLEALSFAEFMKEFREEWLEHEWARKLDSKLRIMRQKNRPFKEWYNDFYSQSLLLTGTSEEMSEKDIRKLVYSLMDDHLRSRADLERIRSLETLKAWTNALINEDRAIRTDIHHLRKRVNGEGHSVSNTGRNGRGSSAPAATSSSSSSADNQRTRLPPLTREERELLDDHDGCFKCRANYVQLSISRAREDAAKRGVKFGSKLKHKENGKGKAVAATTVVSDDDDDVEEVTVSAISGAVEYESESDLVLVSEDFVRWARLPTTPLPQPIKINVAIPAIPDSAASLKKNNEIVYNITGEDGRAFPDRKPEIVAAIASKIVDLNEEIEMAALTQRILSDYADVFGPVPHVADLPEHEFCRVHLKDPSVQLDSRAYPSPPAGRIVPSSSQHSSLAFLVPKADPTADPRLVVDYRKLNANVVPDAYPLPSIPEIFSDCGKARFWCKFDMTNSFFQTRVHPDDRHLFAMNTLVGAFEWVVMPIVM